MQFRAILQANQIKSGDSFQSISSRKSLPASLPVEKIEPRNVCLKLMRNKDQYLTEIAMREMAELDPMFVIAIIATYDGDEIHWKIEQLNSEMVLCRKVMLTTLCHYHGACRFEFEANNRSSPFELVRTAMQSMSFSSKLQWLCSICIEMLIDMDASPSFSADNCGYAGAKYSSAYVPPEMLTIGDVGNVIFRVPPAGAKP